MIVVDLRMLTTLIQSKLSRIKMLGYITKSMPRPSNIGDDVYINNDGRFAEFKIYAIDLSYYADILESDVFCSTSHTHLYLTKGTILVYIPSSYINTHEFIQIEGTLTQSKTCCDYFSLLQWCKLTNGKWAIQPNKFTAINGVSTLKDMYDEEDEVLEWAYSSIMDNKMNYPEEIKDITEVYSSSSNSRTSLADYKQNKYIENEAIYGKSTNKHIDFVEMDRDFIKCYSKQMGELNTCLTESKLKAKTFLDTLFPLFKLEPKEVTTHASNLSKNLLRYLKVKPSAEAMTGRVILRRYLEYFGKEAFEKYLGTITRDFLVENYEDVHEFIINKNHIVMADGVAWTLCAKAFTNPEVFYAGILAIIMGKSPKDFIDIALKLTEMQLSFSKIVNNNPYILNYISDLSFTTVEYIALCMGKAKDNTLELYRDIALVNDYIEDNLKGNTMFTVEDILKANNIGVKLTQAQYEKCVKNSTYISDSIANNLIYYVDTTINPFYDVSAFKQYGPNYYKKIDIKLKEIAVHNYSQSGLGVIYDDKYIISSKILEKELFVYDYMHNLGSMQNDFDMNLIDNLISQYESIIGFSLEEKQKNAVKLIVNKGACITGSAGSGKTTTSNCVVYVLKHLMDNVNIQFAAPTGKAAKRMQEVVKQPVYTLHSLFSIGINSDNTTPLNIPDNTVFLIDESAMITLDVMYSMLKKVEHKNVSFYFFGDVHQLPPIGKGLPFRNFLRFLPCVFLNVSKRAKDGSTITLNSNIINEHSELSNWKDLQSSKDFVLAPCDSNNIQKLVKGICNHYLGQSTPYEDKTILSYLKIDSFPCLDNLTPDDIQVVSPLSKANYKWGTIQLNSLLEPIFNNENCVYSKSFCHFYNDNYYNVFRIGDRVIHKDSNNYNMQWYSTYKNGVYTKTYGYGICNGETGKIVDIKAAKHVVFNNELEMMPDDFKYPNYLRDDSTYIYEPNAYFVVVEYTDYMTNSKYYILYRALGAENESNIGLPLKGDDLGNLSLFYAGTTHKLQGSQARLIISVLDDKENLRNFITRNMMYTVFTRGIDLVFALGSVDNSKSSMLSKARKITSEQGVLTVGEFS